MNILLYTFHYPLPEGTDLKPNTRVNHYFALKLKEMGHQVHVVHLQYYPLKEISPRHAGYIFPRNIPYEVDGIRCNLILYQMLTPHRFYPQTFQAKIINRMLKKIKQELNWKADQVFIAFPAMMTGLTEIFSDTGATFAEFHNVDIDKLKESDPDGKVLDFVKRIRTWGYRNRKSQEYLAGLRPEPPVPAYTGINAELLASREIIEAKKNRAHDRLKIIYVGQLIRLKNTDILIEAVKALNIDAELDIVGDGPEAARLRELAAGADNIRFHGWLDRKQALAEMEKADIFAMVSSPETYGMVYLESMARGCINIATRGEGFDGLIRDGENGFLLEPRNARQITETVEKIAAMTPEERNRLIDAGYELACSMTEDQTTRAYLEANRV